MIRRLWRAHQLRKGRLPRVRHLDALPRAREGVFRLGVCSGGGELAWDPWGEYDAPHLLVAGTTGSGKTRLIEMMALLALDVGWECEIIDFKGGGDYWAATSHGAVVHADPKSAVAALKQAAKDIALRNAAMRITPVHREREDGRIVEDRATTFRDLPPAVRAEHGWRPRLLIIDETASLIADRKGGGMDALREASQLGRSAGVHLVLGLQRPDANLLDGFIKHNVGSRILFGDADTVAEQMVLGTAVGGLDETERAAPRPPGRGIAAGIGGRPVCRFQAFLLARDRYLPFPSAPAPDDPPAPAGGDAPPGGGPASPGPAPPSASSVSGTPPPYGGWVPSPSVPSGRIGPRLRGPAARMALRARALRLVVRPVRSGPFVRDPELAQAVKRRDGFACRACRAGPPLEADHRRPLWAGGQDRAQNLWTLCRKCHLTKTRWETKVRAFRRRRLVGRTGFGRLRWPRLPLYWYGAMGCFAAGLFDGRWAFPAIAVMVLMIWWEFRRRGRWLGVDGMLQSDARAERATYRGTLLGATAATYQTTARTIARVRYGALGGSGVYLAGVMLSSLV